MITSYLGLYFLKALAKAGIWGCALSQRKSHQKNSQKEHEEKNEKGELSTAVVSGKAWLVHHRAGPGLE